MVLGKGEELSFEEWNSVLFRVLKYTIETYLVADVPEGDRSKAAEEAFNRLVEASGGVNYD